MVSLKFNFIVPKRFRTAIRNALGLLKDEDVRNVWDNSNLIVNLSSIDKMLLDELKDLLKDKMIEQFGPYCTYCHRYGTSKASFHIDHFIIKANKQGLARFTYCHKNLILSCIDCNLSKGTKKTFDDNAIIRNSVSYKNLPFLVFHPYLHSVNVHFKILRQTVEGKSTLASNYLGLLGYFDEPQRKQIMNQIKERVLPAASQQRVRLITSKNRKSN